MNRRHCLSSFARLALAMGATLAGLPVLSGCTPKAPLRVGIHPWIGYETLHLARDFNWLPPEVQFHEAKDLNSSAEALHAGQTDTACLTLDSVLRLRSVGVPVSVALVFDVSAGADVVLAQPAIKRLSDLAGKRIGIDQGDLGALVLGKLLTAAGLPASAVVVVDCPSERQLSAWKNKEVDAIISYEPTATLLQREGAHRLFDSRQMPDAIVDVLAVRTDRSDAHKDALQALVAGHFRGLAHLQTNRQDAIHRIAGRENITPNEVQLAVAGLVLPTLEANWEYLSSADGRLMRAAKALSSLMVRLALLEKEDALVGLTSPAWLPRIQS